MFALPDHQKILKSIDGFVTESQKFDKEDTEGFSKYLIREGPSLIEQLKSIDHIEQEKLQAFAELRIRDCLMSYNALYRQKNPIFIRLLPIIHRAHNELIKSNGELNSILGQLDHYVIKREQEKRHELYRLLSTAKPSIIPMDKVIRQLSLITHSFRKKEWHYVYFQDFLDYSNFYYLINDKKNGSKKLMNGLSFFLMTVVFPHQHTHSRGSLNFNAQIKNMIHSILLPDLKKILQQRMQSYIMKKIKRMVDLYELSLDEKSHDYLFKELIFYGQIFPNDFQSFNQKIYLHLNDNLSIKEENRANLINHMKSHFQISSSIKNASNLSSKKMHRRNHRGTYALLKSKLPDEKPAKNSSFYIQNQIEEKAILGFSEVLSQLMRNHTDVDTWYKKLRKRAQKGLFYRDWHGQRREQIKKLQSTIDVTLSYLKNDDVSPTDYNKRAMNFYETLLDIMLHIVKDDCIRKYRKKSSLLTIGQKMLTALKSCDVAQDEVFHLYNQKQHEMSHDITDVNLLEQFDTKSRKLIQNLIDPQTSSQQNFSI